MIAVRLIARLALASCARHWRIRTRPGPRETTCEEAASKVRSRGSRHECHQLTAKTFLLEVSKLPNSPERHRVVIVGAGFAGYNAARELSRLAGASTEITVINSTDYFLYLPLLPQVGAGLVEPRHICVSLLSRMPKVRFVLGTVTHVDVRQKVVTWSSPEGGSGQAGYDRLILTAGSVNKLLPIPGVADYAHGFRSIAEAIYLRDHIIRQLELAAGAADEAERRARCTFVVVGAGYTGTEVAAQGQLLTTRLARQMPGLAGEQIRWMLLDTAPRLLPELDRAAVEDRRPGAAAARGRGAHRPVGRHGPGWLLGAAVHRREGGHPFPHLVRRSSRRPAGDRPGPGHQPGAARG